MRHEHDRHYAFYRLGQRGRQKVTDSDPLDRPQLQVLGIAGSLRAGSYNRALLRAAQELTPAGMEITTFDLSPIPPYNADVE